MARDALTDFHVVRNDSAVLITIQPAAPAQTTPTPPTSLPFPESDDLTFLDHISANLALGHVSLTHSCLIEKKKKRKEKNLSFFLPFHSFFFFFH